MNQRIIMTGLKNCFEDAVNLTNEPNSVIFKDSKFTKIYSGANLPFFNSIFDISFSGQDLESFLESLEKEQKHLGIPLTLWAEDEMPQFLKRNYKTPGPNFGMVLDVDKANLSLKKPGIDIVKVETEQQVDRFIDIYVHVFGFQSQIDFFRKLFLEILHSQSPPWINYLGILNGKAVGCSSLTLTRDDTGRLLGGFYNAAVKPDARGKGIATAMACQRVRDAKELGIDYVSIILMADAMARGYCKKMGFKDICQITPYLITN